MPALLLLLALTQSPPPRAAVVDISAPDAVYEDVSRGQADRVVAALNQAGFSAQRVEEADLPEGGCHSGPCLAEIARRLKADVLITVDAVELTKQKTGVVVGALLGSNGQPLAIQRYAVHSNDKSERTLTKFATDAAAELKKLRRDAGR